MTSILAFALLPCCSDVLIAHSQNAGQTREQKILQIQGLIENQDFNQADELLAEATKEFPADSGLDNLRGIIAARQGNYELAEYSFSQAVRRSPMFTNAYLNLGRLYQEHVTADPQALRKALRVYDRVLQYDRNNQEANYQSAVLLLTTGEYQRSLGHLGRLPAKTQRSAQALSVACADHAGLGNRKRADDAVAQLTADPDFGEEDARQALPGLMAGHRDDLAVSLLESLKSRQALSPDIQHALGTAYERSGKLVQARAALEESVTSETLSVPLLLELARVAHKQQDYRGALGYLAHARDLEPNNAKLHYDFGWVCVDLNLLAEARNSFGKAVKLDPDNPSYNYAMGAISAYQQDPAAVTYFQKYLQLKPQDPRAMLALGNALFRAKDYEAAIPWLTRALKTPDTAPTAHYCLGSIALQQHQPDEALRELGLALQAKPDYSDALAELGHYFLLQRDYSQAEKQLRHALRVDPDHFAANFYLLTLYTRTADSRGNDQAKRFEELQKLSEEKMQDFLRIVEVRPFDAP